MMPGPSIVVYQIDDLRHVVCVPCGGCSSVGMTATDDLQIQVRRALDHARNCGQCLGDTAPKCSCPPTCTDCGSPVGSNYKGGCEGCAAHIVECGDTGSQPWGGEPRG